MSARPVVAVLAPYYLPGTGGGGPIRTVQAMTTEHAARYDFRILTSRRDWGSPEPMAVPVARWTDVGGQQVWYAPDGVRGLVAALREVRGLRPRYVYANSFFDPRWSIPFVVASRAGAFGGARLVLAPRGELGAGALAIKPRKKRLMIRLGRAGGLYRRVTWHASTPQEGAEVRAAFPGAQVVVRENESLLPARARRHAPGTGPVRLVFLSRVSRKKGLHTLLAALARVEVPVELDVHGATDDAAYLTECRELAARLPAHVTARFAGPVAHDEVAGVFAAHDALTLPTEHENFGHVVAEALAQGCPVLLPPVTPWTDRVLAGAGLLVPDRSVDAWGRALARVAAWSPEERASARTRAADAFDAWRADRPVESVFGLMEGER